MWWCTPSLPVLAPAQALLSHVQVGDATRQAVAVPPRTPPSQPPLLVTATGVAVHHHKGGSALGAATQARLRLLFFTFFTTFANVLTLQVFHHRVQVC